MASSDQRSGTMRVAGRPAGARARWGFVLLAALLAFTWQSFVTQTHRHALVDGYSAAPSAGQPLSLQRDRQAPSDSPANCPLCQEIAHAGAYLLPAPIALDVPAPSIAWFFVTRALVSAPSLRSHAWQSRAPPAAFQA